MCSTAKVIIRKMRFSTNWHLLFSFIIQAITVIYSILLTRISYQNASEHTLVVGSRQTVSRDHVNLRKEHKFICNPCGKEVADHPKNFQENETVRNESLHRTFSVI